MLQLGDMVIRKETNSLAAVIERIPLDHAPLFSYLLEDEHQTQIQAERADIVAIVPYLIREEGAATPIQQYLIEEDIKIMAEDIDDDSLFHSKERIFEDITWYDFADKALQMARGHLQEDLNEYDREEASSDDALEQVYDYVKDTLQYFDDQLVFVDALREKEIPDEKKISLLCAGVCPVTLQEDLADVRESVFLHGVSRLAGQMHTVLSQGEIAESLAPLRFRLLHVLDALDQLKDRLQVSPHVVDIDEEVAEILTLRRGANPVQTKKDYLVFESTLRDIFHALSQETQVGENLRLIYKRSVLAESSIETKLFRTPFENLTDIMRQAASTDVNLSATIQPEKVPIVPPKVPLKRAISQTTVR